MSSTALVNIKRAEEYSELKLAGLRRELESIFSNQPLAAVTTGSFARRDACALSDLDYFLITKDPSSAHDATPLRATMNDVMARLGIRAPAVSGAFGETVTIEDLTSNIGGQLDTNDSITRRMLLLLECDYLVDPEYLRKCRFEIVERYINRHMKNHSIARFFLNDLIRYYRTISVDFEFKTSIDGKPWGVRYLKLLFSRKLLYFSGVIVAAETGDCDYAKKRQIVLEMFDQTPRARIQSVLGDRTRPIIEQYDKFLGKMADPAFRDMASATTIDRTTHSKQFRHLKEEGKSLSMQLEQLLRDHYSPSHQIFQALIF